MARSPPSLLLLPHPPVPATPLSFSVAYRPTLEAVVSILQKRPSSTELHILLPCPTISGLLSKPRSHVYSEAQHLLAAAYSLFCAVCAKLSADVDSGTPGSIDARVILLNYSGKTHSIDAEYSLGQLHSLPSGPIVDLPTLALSRRRWDSIFSADSEPGRGLLASFTELTSSMSPPLQGHEKAVPGGIITNVPNDPQLYHIQQPPVSAKVHHVVAVGGTFDHIHAGHKLLLTATALLLQPSSEPRRLIVGITGDELLKTKKYAQYLGSWKQRQDDVVDFLLSILLFIHHNTKPTITTTTLSSPLPNGARVHTLIDPYNITIECVEIQDPFGPTITDESVTALVVSGETRSGGQAVNEKRSEKGWSTLDVFEIDVLDAREAEKDPSKTEEFASKISSTAIRKRMAESGRKSSL